jgi:hypothetical protein
MDEKLIVSLCDEVLGRHFSVAGALALFGEVEEKGAREWRVRPRPQLKGVDHVLFRFFDPAQKVPDDVDLVLAGPWSITATRLAALFGAAVGWYPPGPSLSRRRTLWIPRPAHDDRREGVVQFEIDHAGERVEDLKITLIRFRPIGD